MEVGVIQRNPEDPPERHALASPRSPAEMEQRASAQLDEIRQYLHDRYARRDVATRTSTASGQEIDWVPVESQTAGGTVPEPPEITGDGAPVDQERPTKPAPSELHGAETGPPGTVPVLRKRVDALRPVGNLQDWLAKGPRQRRFTPPDDPHAAPSAADAVHKYAHASQSVTCFGTEGTINTWKPYVQWSNEFSLGQEWLVRGAFGDASLQTLEVGAQTYMDIYGDWNPHLFIYYTTNAYTQSGDNLGGYNTDVTGFVQTGATVFPGMRLAESVPGGDQYDLTLKIQLSEGNWWIRIGNEWMGYYPTSLYNDRGLASEAASVDWGGEIVDDSANHPEPTSTWMGSGHFPADGYGNAAYMRNLSYQSDTAGSMVAVQGYPSATNPASYDIAADFSGTTAWGSYFYWGGPGGI